MSFVNPPQHLYDDSTSMQHLRQYDAPNLHFINHHHILHSDYEHNSNQQNPLCCQNAGSSPQNPDLYTTELHYHGASSSSSSSYNSGFNHQPWVSYPPQNHHLDYGSNATSPNYRLPNFHYSTHHPAATMSQAASQSVFQNTGALNLDMYPAAQRTLAGSLDPSTGVFYRTPEHPRLRTAQACLHCQKRKVMQRRTPVVQTVFESRSYMRV
ncbi:hypothetical protein J3R30DRAFT_1583936 [Lentinula aciculospora]|uniref:Uncharacterized protein n=1 Tax=Lentinula aciculospora TaxID=153920 RepID=A0A9W8ZY11_9AGAR|nr:hypothetical protein J3R30DRAFT_1583936 [Lentinula aciculospora]